MKGILILAHGSREKSTQNTLNQIVDYLKADFKGYEIESSYLQFSDNNLENGLNSLKAKGATEIVVIPYFLFSGVHIREDIPEEIKCYTAKNPDIKISMGETLGADKRLAQILSDRVKSAL